MLKHHLAACLMATALVAAPALAQTNQAPATSAPVGSTAAPATPTQGAAAPMQGGTIQYITQNRPDLWRASKLEGVNVYNEQNERIGDISEVLVNKQGEVEAVVIGVGGFLGIGERDVAVPFNALQWVQEPPRTAATAPETTPGGAVTAPVAPRDTTAAAPPAPTDGRVATAPAAPPAAQDNMGMTTGTVGDGVADTRYDLNRDYPDRAILAGASKDQLKQAPEFRFQR